MRYIQHLGEGARFKVAHPEQTSKNGLKMPTDQIFTVDRHFETEPFYVVTRLIDGPDRRPRTLSPLTPVVLPNEPTPTKEEVEEFVLGKPTTREVVGFKLAWDGTKSEVYYKLPPSLREVVDRLLASGHKEFDWNRIREVLSKKYLGFVRADALLRAKWPAICELGLLSPSFDERPKQLRDLREVIGI